MVIEDQQYGLEIKFRFYMKNCIVIFLLLGTSLFISCSKCGYEKAQVIHGLKNFQSVVGFIRNCGATTSYSINVTFVKPGMDLGDDKADVFSASVSTWLHLEKISEDTVKIIFVASEDRILHKENELYGIHFIYENNGKYFNKKESNSK